MGLTATLCQPIVSALEFGVLNHPESIVTESQPMEKPEWGACIDALLKTWTKTARRGETPPNEKSCLNALAWVVYLKSQFPMSPPTCIVPEPEGGIIVEREITIINGMKRLFELTFYNSGAVEWTSYMNGKVGLISPMPPSPQDVNTSILWA